MKPQLQSLSPRQGKEPNSNKLLILTESFYLEMTTKGQVFKVHRLFLGAPRSSRYQSVACTPDVFSVGLSIGTCA